MLFEILTGEPPFLADASRSYTWHHVLTEPPRIRNLRPDVPQALENLLVNPSLREDLLFSLAHVKFVGGSHREAVGLFEEVGLAYAQRYGPADDQTLLCRDQRLRLLPRPGAESG